MIGEINISQKQTNALVNGNALLSDASQHLHSDSFGSIRVVSLDGIQAGYNMRGVTCGMNYLSACDSLLKRGYYLKNNYESEDTIYRDYSNGKETIQLNTDNLSTVTYMRGTLD